MLDNHVDLTVIGTLRDVMETEYPALLHIYIKDSEARITDLNGLIQNLSVSSASVDQLHTLRATAHSFKGSSANMGAAHLADLCHLLEQHVQSVEAANSIRTAELVEAIHAEFIIVRDFFDVELKTTLTAH